MFVVRFIDIPGIDVEPAADKHVFFAIHNVEVPVLIHRGDIARVAPAVAQQACGFFRFVQIALGDLRSADDQFTGLTDGHIHLALVQIDDAALGIRYGQADRTDLPDAFKGIDMGDGGGFGHAESFHNHGARDLLKIMNHFHRQGSASGEETLEARHIRVFYVRMVQHADKHSRNQRSKVGFKFFNGFQKRFRLRFGDQDISPGLINGKVHCDGHAEHMEEGQCAQVDVVCAVKLRKPGADLLHLLADVAVGQNNAFGNARGAPRVLVHGVVVERQFDLGRVGL